MILSSGTFHELTDDIRHVLQQDPALAEKRNALTPLARNEWICRVTIVKKSETRAQHIERLSEDISSGKKRPCCRPGCPHRRDSAKKRFPGMKNDTRS